MFLQKGVLPLNNHRSDSCTYEVPKRLYMKVKAEQMLITYQLIRVKLSLTKFNITKLNFNDELCKYYFL